MGREQGPPLPAVLEVSKGARPPGSRHLRTPCGRGGSQNATSLTPPVITGCPCQLKLRSLRDGWELGGFHFLCPSTFVLTCCPWWVHVVLRCFFFFFEIWFLVPSGVRLESISPDNNDTPPASPPLFADMNHLAENAVCFFLGILPFRCPSFFFFCPW